MQEVDGSSPFVPTTIKTGLPKSIEELFGKRSNNGAKLRFMFHKPFKAKFVVTRGYGSVGRAIRSQRIGRRFDPDYLHHEIAGQSPAFFVVEICRIPLILTLPLIYSKNRYGSNFIIFAILNNATTLKSFPFTIL